MLAKTPIQTRFYHYVCGKDPDEYYCWTHRDACACGQFIRDENIENSDDLALIWGECFVRAPRGPSLNAIALGQVDPEGWVPLNNKKQWNFGALRARLEAAGYAD
jgi:hypothetical protein